MCGIAGQINFSGSVDPSCVESMVRGIRHRGPDDSGIWRSHADRCVLGHARLSIIDLSQAGHQPMVDPETGNIIVFNGEIYNHSTLRRECEKLGDHFMSTSDTEVILALYRRLGKECLKKLRGMFAFAIWDQKHQHLFIARDRVGKKPFNYVTKNNQFIFCSEINPLAHHPDVSTAISNDGLELYLQLQYIPAPWTIYQDIKKLPPAHYAIVAQDMIEIEQYWDIEYNSDFAGTEDDAVDALEEKLKEAVELRMHADVDVGALLSGGIDSSVVVALMAGLTSEKIKTYSIGFAEDAFNELSFAQQVAHKFATDHQPAVVSGEVDGLLSDIVKHYGEPFADSSAIPSFHVSKNARAHIKVVLNGDGGDELLGGYSRYKISNKVLNFSSKFGGAVSNSRAVDWAAALADTTTISGKVKRRLLLRMLKPEMQSVLMYSNFWNDTERAALMNRVSPLLAQWRKEWLEAGYGHAKNSVDKMLYIDNRTYLPGDLLVKMDIASMHCGLEARSPFLDHEVIEFCAKLPTKFKVNRNEGKYLLKKLAERYFPKEFVYRKKMGFGIPLSSWLKGPLRELVNEVLRNETLMSPLQSDVINKYLTEFYQYGYLHESRIWTLLMFGLWKKHCALEFVNG